MSETVDLLSDSVDRMLAQHAGAHASPDFARPLWDAAVDAGLVDVLAQEGDPDAMRSAVAILRRCARVGAPIPIAEGMLAAWLASRAGLTAASGLVTVAIDARAGASAARLHHVPWGRHAVRVMALVREGGDCRIACHEHATSLEAEGHSLAGEPRDTLRVDAAPRIASVAVDEDEIVATAALLRAAQMTGAMDATLELAIDHARTRQQFGRPIGAFQAVQQLLARHAEQVAAAAAAVDLAADRWGGPSGTFHAAVAKSRAGEAAGIAAECAHQVIAAMGFSMEHPLQRVTRRLWTWRDDFGNESHWNEIIGARILDAGADAAWLVLVDEPAPEGS